MKFDGAADRIRGDTVLSDLPVVLVSSSQEDTDYREATRLGISDYIVKTGDYAVFREDLRRLEKRLPSAPSSQHPAEPDQPPPV